MRSRSSTTKGPSVVGVAALIVEIAKINATVVEEPTTRIGTLDVDQVVARRRRTRSVNPP